MNPQLKRYCVIALAIASQVCTNVIAQSPNLIVNPDFEEGITGFYSDYTSFPITVSSGYYTVTSDPIYSHTATVLHQDYSGSGNMLFVNGSTNPNDVVWGTLDPLNVEMHTNYKFEAWVANWYDQGGMAFLTFQIKDALGEWVDLVSIDTSSIDPGTWTPVTATWNSGDVATTELRLVNAQTAEYGNDFAIDHISFSQDSSSNVPEPTSMLFFGITGFAAILRRRRWM